MSPFRCPSGHRVELAFGNEQVRLPCPACGLDVYRFRDALDVEDAPGLAGAGEPAGPDKPHLPLDAKRLAITIGGGVFAVAGLLFAWYWPAVPPAAAGQGTVIPVKAVPGPAPADPSAVSITNFSATPTGSGGVNVSFRLANSSHTPRDYPGFIVHWHGVPEADQQVGKDAYAHPPLPFTSTDVRLELARPLGATGVDVKIRD